VLCKKVLTAAAMGYVGFVTVVVTLPPMVNDVLMPPPHPAKDNTATA
jgi:hypothetical protein